MVHYSKFSCFGNNNKRGSSLPHSAFGYTKSTTKKLSLAETIRKMQAEAAKN